MGCDIYYLDHFREALAEKKVAEAEELMRAAKVSMKMASEHTAKLALDLAFLQIQSVHNNNVAKVRLVRYAVELCHKAKDGLDV